MRWTIAIASVVCCCCVGTVDAVVIVRVRPVDETGRQYTDCRVALSGGASESVFEEARRIGQSDELEAIVPRDRAARRLVPVVRCDTASVDYVGHEIGWLRGSLDMGEIVIARDPTE